ncbi:hypothetical protein IV203_007301 [Nitzschia inconspicua]|uniref:Uncharacterized protein n=1 Tax=Nitzschia inconspicua TaxID=303405 RepID=A0A9K3PEP7_9STRA|nr:hypothetical protein IV203_007301 [Nitzschia inconspicua]
MSGHNTDDSTADEDNVVHHPEEQADVDPDPSAAFMINESAIEAAAAIAVEHVGDMHEAVEAALGVSEENPVIGGGDDDDDDDDEKNGRKRYRKPDDEDGAQAKSVKRIIQSHEDQLAARRHKDRQRYASMTPEQRQVYNAKRREQYHRQSENSRQRRRERERARYHALQLEAAKDRNARRAKLERERYQRLTPEELEAKNRRRRERAALARQKKAQERSDGSVATSEAPPKVEEILEDVETKVDAEAEAAAAAAAEEGGVSV